MLDFDAEADGQERRRLQKSGSERAQTDLVLFSCNYRGGCGLVRSRS